MIILSYKKLWKKLIDINMTKMQLKNKANISSNALAKLGKDEIVTMKTLIKICLVLDCKIDDIVDYSIFNDLKKEN